MTPTNVQTATNPISNPLQFHRLVKLVLTYQVMTSTVDQNATNPSSNPLRFHRLVILGKPIPNDVFKSVLFKKKQFNGLPINNQGFKTAPVSSISDIGKNLTLLMFQKFLVKKNNHFNGLPVSSN